MDRIVWLLGPSGVGKSTVGWLVFRRLAAGAYVDTDQLGLCYPPPADDPDNHRTKARNLARLHVPDSPLVVSGRVENAVVMRSYLEEIGPTAVTLCRLRVGPAELRRRILDRGGVMARLADAAVEEGDALDRDDFADLTVDTSGRTAGEVASSVLARTGLLG